MLLLSLSSVVVVVVTIVYVVAVVRYHHRCHAVLSFTLYPRCFSCPYHLLDIILTFSCVLRLVFLMLWLPQNSFLFRGPLRNLLVAVKQCVVVRAMVCVPCWWLKLRNLSNVFTKKRNKN